MSQDGSTPRRASRLRTLALDLCVGLGLLALAWAILAKSSLPGGIAHAFNGSFQQAETFIALGFRLGFGGAMTFPRALQIRRLAAAVPETALVLETDAPDISPVWLHPQRNTPEQLPRIGAALAELRCMPVDEIARITTANAQHALPRLQRSA